jgi:hypothetical protein
MGKCTFLTIVGDHVTASRLFLSNTSLKVYQVKVNMNIDHTVNNFYSRKMVVKD